MDGYLKKQFAYFLAHQDDLVRDFNGKVVVIADEKVDGAFPSELEAVESAKQRHPLGKFLVQRVAPGEETVTQVFHSRVAFR